LPFECNWQCYIAAAAEAATAQQEATDAEKAVTVATTVGLCTLNQVDP
jgi:hypothetical protein